MTQSLLVLMGCHRCRLVFQPAIGLGILQNPTAIYRSLGVCTSPINVAMDSAYCRVGCSIKNHIELCVCCKCISVRAKRPAIWTRQRRRDADSMTSGMPHNNLTLTNTASSQDSDMPTIASTSVGVALRTSAQYAQIYAHLKQYATRHNATCNLHLSNSNPTSRFIAHHPPELACVSRDRCHLHNARMLFRTVFLSLSLYILYIPRLLLTPGITD